jgi:hypothetical protein
MVYCFGYLFLEKEKKLKLQGYISMTMLTLKAKASKE